MNPINKMNPFLAQIKKGDFKLNKNKHKKLSPINDSNFKAPSLKQILDKNV